jgi:hypothetical protein
VPTGKIYFRAPGISHWKGGPVEKMMPESNRGTQAANKT